MDQIVIALHKTNLEYWSRFQPADSWYIKNPVSSKSYSKTSIDWQRTLILLENKILMTTKKYVSVFHKQITKVANQLKVWFEYQIDALMKKLKELQDWIWHIICLW